MEIKMTDGYIDNPDNNIEISIKGNVESRAELKEKAIKSLLNGLDPKIDFKDGSYQEVQDFVENVLIATVDVLGYQHYYWDQVSDNETSYNEYDELEVTKKAKIEYLEQVVRDMKAKLK